jgi:putative ABC transport system substrate-binding protein
MNRRDLLALLGGAVAWPVAARAQQPAMPVIGFLSTGTSATNAPTLEAFRRGLGQSGYIEGKNVEVDYRYANENYDQLPALAADLVRRRVKVIATSGGNLSPLAAKTATATIPIVFAVGSDPVALGLVATLNRPGGNATGASFLSGELGPKRLDLLHQLMPAARSVAVLLNPANPTTAERAKDFQAAAKNLGLETQILLADNDKEIDAAFVALAERHAGALLLGPDNFLFSRNEQIAALALSHRVPAMYQWREFVAAGGLISYGPSQSDGYRQVGVYVGRILKGESPAELPVVQTTEIEMVINLRTAKALGLTVPPNLLATADEVIE